ncbi:MAG TPA: lipocalin-like domain-containing protein [Ktedonobacteraceae bacterium]|nr:lipocalin-like domain-containing protein [Ktedonobacteraceae bacterium]
MIYDKKYIQLAQLLPIIIVFASCGFPGLTSTAAQLPVVQSTPTQASLPPVRFPQDEAPHRDLTEWWYYTGHLNATIHGQLHHYGFELVFFQVLRADFPPIYASHFAISDVTRGEFHFDQRRQAEVNAVLPNGTTTTGFDVNIGDWSIRGVNGLDHLAAGMSNYTLRIDVRGLKPPVLHNGDGLITFGLGGFSYYYSRTRMAVSGTLVDHGQALAVSGEAWMDHQWGNFVTLGGGGWDWFSIQLANNTELMLYLIRDATGKIVSTYVGYILPDAQERLLPPQSLRVQVLDHWRSSVTGVVYPSGWLVQIHDAQLYATLTLLPELKNQELVVYQSTGNSYWEGAVSIVGQDNGSAISGEGYVELTGYQP